MAIDNFNPTNAPGIGAAYILQGNQAANVFNNNIAQQEQQMRVAEFQRQKQLAAEQQNITENLAKVSPGDYWINHDKEIQGDYKTLMDYGTKLKYEGKNPFSDQDFLAQKQQLESKAKFSKQLQDDYKLIQAELIKNPDGYDNADEASSFFSGNKTISDYMKEGYKRPELVKRYATTDILEGLKPSTREYGDGNKIVVGADTAQNKMQVLSKIDTPAFTYLLTKAGANPQISAFGKEDKNGLPVFPTDDAYVTERAKDLVQSPEGLNLLSGRITGPEDPQALSMMKDLVKKQNAAYSKVIDDAARALDAQADSKFRKDDMNARLGLAYSSEARQNRKENAELGQSTYRQDWINRMFDGVENSGEELVAAVKGNPEYEQDLKIQRVKGDASKIVIKVPDKVTKTDNGFGSMTEKRVPGRTVAFDKNDANDKIALNQLINELTGEKVDISALKTFGGKKKVSDSDASNAINKPSADPLNIF